MDNFNDRLVAKLMMNYYDWMIDAGGMSSDDILALTLTPAERQAVLSGMDDINVICGFANLIRSQPKPCRSGPTGHWN
jgi:hypothetical protein